MTTDNCQPLQFFALPDEDLTALDDIISFNRTETKRGFLSRREKKSEEFKNMKKIAIGLVIATLVCVGTVFTFAKVIGDPTGLDAVFAQDENGGKFGHGFMMRRIFDRIAGKLNLTAEQKTQIHQIVENERPNVQPLLAQALATHQQMEELGKDGVFDEKQVEALATQQAATMKQLIIEKERTKARIFAVLTTEQRQQAEQLREQFEQKVRGKIMAGL